MKKKPVNYFIKTVELPVWHWTVQIVFTDNVIAYGEHRGWKAEKEQTVNAITLFFDDSLTSVLVFGNNPSPGTIAHEVWHAVRRMLTHMGAELDNEVVAYHLGYLVEEVYKAKKLRKKRKSNGQ